MSIFAHCQGRKCTATAEPPDSTLRNMDKALQLTRALIRLAMARTNLDASALAKVAGLPHTTLTRFISISNPPKHAMTFKTALKVAEAAGIDLFEAFTGVPDDEDKTIHREMFTRRLRVLCDDSGFNDDKTFAIATGIQSTRLAAIFAGLASPTFDELDMLSSTLDISLDELVRGIHSRPGTATRESRARNTLHDVNDDEEIPKFKAQ